MTERNLDFDQLIERKGTSSLKFDFAAQRGQPDDLLPMWVADMDFRTSSYVQDALIHSAEHGIYGYTETGEEYFAILKGWMKNQYNWELESPDWLIKTPGIVFALAMAVKAFTRPGDAVLIQQPRYYSFANVILSNDRKVVSNTLIDSGTNRYSIDFEDFEQKIVENDIHLFLLCNPHNPGGTVWTEEELRRMGDICLRNHVVVVSDEIHADFVWTGRHHVFAALSPQLKENCVICTSPGKSFNIASLQISNIFIPNSDLRKAFQKEVDGSGYSQANGTGIFACEAAYQYGEEWLSAVRKYIYDNILYTKKFLETELPEVRMMLPEATYLVWLDFRSLGLKKAEMKELIVDKAKLWLDHGEMFGAAGSGYQRINVACPRSVLRKALEQLRDAVKNI